MALSVMGEVFFFLFLLLFYFLPLLGLGLGLGFPVYLRRSPLYLDTLKSRGRGRRLCGRCTTYFYEKVLVSCGFAHSVEQFLVEHLRAVENRERGRGKGHRAKQTQTKTPIDAKQR